MGCQERHGDHGSNHIGTQTAEIVKSVIFRVLNGVLNPGKAQDRLEVVNVAGTKIHEIINALASRTESPSWAQGNAAIWRAIPG